MWSGSWSCPLQVASLTKHYHIIKTRVCYVHVLVCEIKESLNKCMSQILDMFMVQIPGQSSFPLQFIRYKIFINVLLRIYKLIALKYCYGCPQLISHNAKWSLVTFSVKFLQLLLI